MGRQATSSFGGGEDPEVATPGAFLPSQLPTFIHRLAIALQRCWNGATWDLAATLGQVGESLLTPEADILPCA